MRTDWLWDRKISMKKVKEILNNSSNKEFVLFASLLLARKNEPKEVFKEYLKPLIFCRQWSAIKRQMRRNKWSEPRIIFWQAIYEKLIERYRKQGISFRGDVKRTRDALREDIGGKIAAIRKDEGLSQENLAKRLNVSQQLISRIESGNENISIGTLKNISRALNKKIKVEFV